MSDWLMGWKRIAVYLDVSVSTAQRWEKENHLPVHAPGGSVAAKKSELEEWMKRRKRAV